MGLGNGSSLTRRPIDKKTYIPIGDSYKEEFMKYISQKSIFL